MFKAIQKRRSCRTYSGKKIDKRVIDEINLFISKINQESKLNIELIENAGNAFSSAKLTYGLFRNVRTIILMKGESEIQNFKEKIGYFGERLVLKLTDMGLDTCWVGATFDTECFSILNGEELVAVIACGYGEKGSLKDKIVGVNHKIRKPINKRIESDKDIPNWIRDGMEAVVLAPSAMNKQKPRFYYKNGIFTAEVADDYRFDLVDLGIAKYYFEIGASRGKFEFGNGAKYVREVGKGSFEN